MLRGFLVSEKDVLGPRRVPVATALTVGRAPECGFVIEDGAASRRHLQIIDRGGDFYWKDLGSTNGTVVNGSRMLEGRLKAGDRLQIGDTVLRFDVEEVEETGPSPEESTMFKQTILDDQGHAVTQRARGRAEDLLQAVYSVMDHIATNYEPCSLADQILETTVSAVRAERGAILFVDAAGEALRPCPVCGSVHMLAGGKLERVAQDVLRISNTVVQRVLQNGESVLYKEGSGNGSVDPSESMVSLNLRSVLCAPLRGKYQTLGLMYLDSTRSDRQYSHDDMLLATAVAKSAGLAIENANMHHQILEKQRIEQEIAFAWSIQEGFLVKAWPEGAERFEVYGETQPAKTVGGDFYDYARPAPETVGILIGDVSGKGVPAALTMAQVLAEFRLRAQGQCPPAEVLRALNENLTARSRFGIFCTLCYLTVDLATGRVVCANAGHHPVARIGPKGAELIGSASGPPAGVLPDLQWQNEEFRIEPGETLLLYTDGIAEARRAENGAPCEYGAEGILQLACRQPDRHPRDLIGSLIDDVREFCAPSVPHDDCTLIALRYLG